MYTRKVSGCDQVVVKLLTKVADVHCEHPKCRNMIFDVKKLETLSYHKV